MRAANASGEPRAHRPPVRAGTAEWLILGVQSWSLKAAWSALDAAPSSRAMWSMAAQRASTSAGLCWSQSHMSNRHVFFVGGSHSLFGLVRLVGHIWTSNSGWHATKLIYIEDGRTLLTTRLGP
jgi:hypothetical protein